MIQRKKTCWIFFIGLVVLTGCGGKYADLIDANHQFIGAMEKFAAAMDRVENAEEAAVALNNMAGTMETLMPKMKALSEKYPELQNQEALPEKLATLEDEAKAAGQKFSQSMMKLMPYMQDPAVQQAQMRLTRAMGQVGSK